MSPFSLDSQLDLMRMESRLVEALYEHPGAMHRPRENALRYALGLARVRTFQPGAAALGRRNQRPDVTVTNPALERYRRVVTEHVGPALRARDTKKRLLGAAKAFDRVHVDLVEARDSVLSQYANDFSAKELDQEVGRKTLVNVAGGGGGAGYVYVGAWEHLQAAGLVPGYVIGSSIGAVLGLFRALAREGDFDEYMAFAKGLSYDEIFRVVSVRARYGLPGVLRLFLHAAIGSRFQHASGRNLRLSDLEIPFESVVAGVRRGALSESPAEYAVSHHLPEDRRPGPLELRAQVASQLVRAVGFFNPRMVREIVIGADELTREFDCVDAAGFSAAVPGVLHYDVSRPDARMHAVLSELMRREEVVALVDGGVANNVPANTAYRRVQEGVIGTRNAFYLGFDCFHPQTSLGHLALHPIERIVSLQVALNQRYLHECIRFPRTLSPMNLLPSESEMDRAVRWGREAMADRLGLVRKYFEEVRWIDD